MKKVKVKNLKRGDCFKFIEESFDETARQFGWRVTGIKNKIIKEVILRGDRMLLAVINNHQILLSDYHFLWDKKVQLTNRNKRKNGKRNSPNNN